MTRVAREVCARKVDVVCGFKRFWHHFQGLWQIYKIYFITHVNVRLSELLIYLGPLQQIFKSKFSYELQ